MSTVTQLKEDLKQWELQFTKEYRRKPTKPDIRSRKDIYAKYMLYNKLQRQEKAKEPLFEKTNLPFPSSRFKEFKFNVEDQSTLSPPPISPPKQPTCDESFLKGYFDLSYKSNTKSQTHVVRHQVMVPMKDVFIKDSGVGKKRSLQQMDVEESEEPQRKRRKLDNPTSEPIAASDSFQWGTTDTRASNKRENFVRMNLRKGKRGAGRSSGRRGVKGSSKALRMANVTTELKEDSTTIEEFPMTEEAEEIPNFEENISSSSLRVEPVDDGQILIQALELLNKHFGFSSFRAGQQDAVLQVIQRKSTLVCIPTGSGKSLIYQLPALFIPKGSIVLVISPLISLINDQLKKLPPCLVGATINSSQSRKQINAVYDGIRQGRVNILFISPEKLLSNEFQKMITFANPEGLRVKVHFACIDEAHCISQWSHNFRPSYLRVSSILKNMLNVPCILALSATCTASTRQSICDILNITPDNVILQSPVRTNLSLSVSSDRDKYIGLLQLLQSDEYVNLSSIIIYCAFQQDTEHLSSFLQSKQFDAMAYHAGKSYGQRKSVQNLFMSNKLRIVVATVAFGMGVDKSDVRAVIHFSMPRSVEAYVQEVGRAGRDNAPAFGHLFLHPDDMTRSYKLCFTDYIDRTAIKRLMVKIFRAPDQLGAGLPNAPSTSSYLVSLPLEDICCDLDIKKEVIDTLLTYLQLPVSAVSKYFSLRPPTPCLYTIQFITSEPQQLARKYNIIHSVIEHGIKSAQGKWRCDIVNIANHYMKDVAEVREELCRLQTMEEITFEVEEQNCALLHVHSSPDPENLELAINESFEKMEGLQHTKEAQSKNSMDQKALEKEREVDYQIERYFREANSSYLKESISFPDWPIMDPTKPISQTKLNYLKGDIAMMVSRERETIKNGLIGARILHGIGSPKFPADRFFHYKFWGSYPHVDFFHLVKMINQTLAFKRD